MLDNGDYVTFGKSQKLTFIFRVATRRDAEELADYAFEEELGRFAFQFLYSLLLLLPLLPSLFLVWSSSCRKKLVGRLGAAVGDLV